MAAAKTLRPALPDAEDKTDDLQYDLGNLTAFDTHPIDPQALKKEGKEVFLRRHARDNAQLLFNQIFALDTESHNDVGRMCILPAPSTPLPRHRPVPKPKPETRWQKFAREKNIKNTKRDRMVWDEQKEEWAPRHGYKRANDDLKDWAIEVGANDDPYEDPFQKKRMEKKERTLKNKLQHLGNQDRAAGIQTPHGLKPNLSIPDSRGSTKRVKIGLGKDATKEAMRDAQRSSASMGKFDKKLKGEKAIARKGKRRKKLSVTGSGTAESEMAQKVLDRVLG
jgi:regulator of ribosome biosynthesis